MDEQLIGYLLGALEAPEHEEVQDRLDGDPQWRSRLADLEARLAPFESSRGTFDPPAGLSQATCARVRRESQRVTRERKSRPASSQQDRSQLSEWNPRKHGWDLIDMVVAAGIFLAAGLLFFPAIANSRQQSRQLACQNKLREGAFALAGFGNLHDGILPYIPTRGKVGVAGYYAPQLMETGFLIDHSSILCPSSALASQRRGDFRIPTSTEIQAASGARLEQLQRTMGGSYRYTLGNLSDGVYRATRNRGRTYFPVMSDSTRRPFSSTPMALAHGDGVNVIFEGGNLLYLVDVAADHPYFVSDRGLVESGVDVNDAVLGHSWDRPRPGADDKLPIGGQLDPESDLWQDLQAMDVSL